MVEAPADDHHVAALDRHVVVGEHGLDAGRRARQRAGRPRASSPRLTGWSPSASLAGSTAEHRLVESKPPGSGELDQVGVDGGVGVEAGDGRLEQVGLAGVGRQVLVDRDACPTARAVSCFLAT